MRLFILATFVLLAGAFYIMSGGNEFDPPEIDREPSPIARAPEPSPAEPASTAPEPVEPETAQSEPAEANDKPAPTAEVDPEGTSTVDQAQIAASIAEALNSTEESEAQPTDDEANAASESITLPSLAQDMRRVDGTAVNMRDGPGTEYGVVDQLVQNERVAVLQELNGWSEVVVQSTGLTGWIANFLLTSG